MGLIIPNMGPKRQAQEAQEGGRTSLGDALFFGVQRRVLGLLFGHPDQSFHGNEIIGLTASGRGAVRRELDRLAAAGLLTVTPVGNQKRYQANPRSPIFAEIRAIVSKTFGVADEIRSALAGLAHRISLAFVYGSVAKQTDTSSSDVDLLVVSDKLGYQDLLGALEACEARIGRRINPTVFSANDFGRERSERDSFVNRVLEQSVIALIGDPHASTESGKPGKGRPAQAGAARKKRV
jgi:predicted nucleotidyltransferase